MTLFKTFFLFFAILVVSSSDALAQDCVTCKKTPKVAMYDLDVQVAKPSDTGELMLQWRQLFWLSKFAQAKLSELNKNCVRFIQPFTTNEDGKSVFVLNSITKPTLPSSSSSIYGDYILTGNVSQVGVGYSMNLELQTACTHQRVASASVPFHASIDPDYMMSIAHQAATKLSPLIEQITEFSKKQRETNNKVAYSNWGTESITLKPKRNTLASGEETEVEVSMKDCDGYVLANREIVFTKGFIEGMPINGTTGGTVTPSSVITDENGKAKVRFKMGESKTAIISAHYSFNKPSGCAEAMIGSVPINGIPMKVTVEYEMDQDVVVTPKMDLGAVKSEGGEEHLFFMRSYRSVFYHYPAKEEYAPENLLLFINSEAPLKSTTIFESEDGFFFYMKRKKEMKVLTEFMGKKIFEEKVDESVSETNYGRINPLHNNQFAFYKETEIEPMRFIVEFKFKNEELEHEVGTGGFPGGISVSKNDSNAKLTVNKINDPKSIYKTEYIIEMKRSPGDDAELDKMFGTNFKQSMEKSGYKTSGNEHVRIKVLSPY